MHQKLGKNTWLYFVFVLECFNVEHANNAKHTHTRTHTKAIEKHSKRKNAAIKIYNKKIQMKNTATRNGIENV